MLTFVFQRGLPRKAQVEVVCLNIEGQQAFCEPEYLSFMSCMIICSRQNNDSRFMIKNSTGKVHRS